ncbi:MAG: sulfate adenylyltransferase [Ignavibacteriales bacterium]|nr:sulfate adenylyltransferase [Ignavibacteriales bacterium]
MELLRFTTAGSVDDGKSTLIGRLLYDSKSIFEDQLEAIEKSSRRAGGEEVNLALLTDGLKDERAQGITIDVAYRYFSTPKRKFIIADTPGHVQYTRNMVTGASTANLALILVDARHGVVEQTLRHAYIASLLKIPHIALCVNKMDLVDYDQETFERIVEDFKGFATKLDVKDIRFVPISALKGDNVVNRSEKMKWYNGSTLLYLLETIHIAGDYNHVDARLPVQYVVRPQKDEYHDYRGYAGQIAGGIFRVGDEVEILPSGFQSKVKSIDVLGDSLPEAFPPLSVSVQLEDDFDISRGDMLAKPNNKPEASQDIDATVCWFNAKPLQLKKKYYIRHTTNEAKCIVNDVVYKMDVNTLKRNTEDANIAMNDVARVKIRATKPLFFDSYKRNRITGSFILIDEGTNETVAAGMIV